MIRCFVRGCAYVAETAFDDFRVCSLHDAPQVLALLEAFKSPHAYWCAGRPIVLPCGDLDESDFVERPAVMFAVDDELLANVDETPTRLVSPCYDLTATDFMGR